jgi:hypothetical protein
VVSCKPELKAAINSATVRHGYILYRISVVAPRPLGESVWAGLAARRRRVQMLLRMAGAAVNSVSFGGVGRVAQVGCGLCSNGKLVPVLGGGVERAAEGNQDRILAHDQCYLTSGCT